MFTDDLNSGRGRAVQGCRRIAYQSNPSKKWMESVLYVKQYMACEGLMRRSICLQGETLSLETSSIPQTTKNTRANSASATIMTNPIQINSSFPRHGTARHGRARYKVKCSEYTPGDVYGSIWSGQSFSILCHNSLSKTSRWQTLVGIVM